MGDCFSYPNKKGECMRAKIIHVTDHALLRWSQRVSNLTSVFEIVKAIQQSRVIKKCEPLPYPLPRLEGSVYSIHNGVMFVMESVTIDEYRLVTVVSESIPRVNPPKKLSKEKKQEKRLQKKFLLKEKQQERKSREEEEHERPQRIRSKTRSIHVQSAVAGLSDLAPQRDASLQPPVEQDSAA